MERLVAMINGNALSPPLSFRNAIPVGADRAATTPSLGRGDGPDLGLVAGYDAEQFEALHGERAGRARGGACGPLTPHQPAVSVVLLLVGLRPGTDPDRRVANYKAAALPRCRAKNRSELSVSNDGRSPCLPGLGGSQAWWWQCFAGGTSRAGLPSKKPSGLSWNPTRVTGITGQSSGRTTW